MHFTTAISQRGEIGNNPVLSSVEGGTDNTDYNTAIGNNSTIDGSGPFREGATSGTAYSDFDQNYTAINTGSGAEGPNGQYTVRQGDTLDGIAQSLWGDASLWYMLAQANPVLSSVEGGLSGNASLSAGQSQIVPSGVTNFHNNAGTFRPYDAGKAIGDVQAQDSSRFSKSVRQQVAYEGARGLEGSALVLKDMLPFGSYDGKTTSINSVLGTLGGYDSNIGGISGAAAFEELGHWADRRGQFLSKGTYADPPGDEGAAFALAAVAAATRGRSGDIGLSFALDGRGRLEFAANSTILKAATLSSVATGRIFSNNVVDGVQMWGPDGHFGTTFLTSLGVGKGLGVDAGQNNSIARVLGVASQIPDMFSAYDAKSLGVGKAEINVLGLVIPLATKGGSRGPSWTVSDERYMRTMYDGLHALPKDKPTSAWYDREQTKTENYVISQFKAGEFFKARVALHRYGDLFAHRGYYGDLGHMFTGNRGHTPDLMFDDGNRFNVGKVMWYQRNLSSLLSRAFIARGLAAPGRSIVDGTIGGQKYFTKFYNDDVGSARTEGDFLTNILKANSGFDLKYQGAIQSTANMIPAQNSIILSVANALKSK